MSKKRARRTAALFLALVLTCGSASNVMAAEAGESSTEDIVMAEEQQESETSEITETSKNPSENTEASSGRNIALLCIPGVVMVFGLAGILLWRRRKQCKG